MTSPDTYSLVLAPPARRAVAVLPPAVASAVIEFITTALLENPRRVGKPLRGDLEGVWSARRGTYRVQYRILAPERETVVLRVEHRLQAYRPPIARGVHPDPSIISPG